jgi:hypothetical protein
LNQRIETNKTSELTQTQDTTNSQPTKLNGKQNNQLEFLHKMSHRKDIIKTNLISQNTQPLNNISTKSTNQPKKTVLNRQPTQSRNNGPKLTPIISSNGAASTSNSSLSSDTINESEKRYQQSQKPQTSTPGNNHNTREEKTRIELKMSQMMDQIVIRNITDQYIHDENINEQIINPLSIRILYIVICHL